MRYIIVNGCAYEIHNGKAYKVTFLQDTTQIVSESEVIDDLSNHETFSYYEIIRKLNVRDNYLKANELEETKEEIVEETKKEIVQKPISKKIKKNK